MNHEVPKNCPSFDIGQKLDLIPRVNPPEPWGYGVYPPPTPSQLDNLATHPSGFDPNADIDKKTTATVKIIKRHSNTLKHGHQVLLCKMTKYPRSLAQPQMPFPRFDPETKTDNSVNYFILKVSDGLLFPRGLGVPPYDNWQLAEHFHVRESAALRFHYEKHLVRGDIMGPPYHVPSYYGTWIVKLPYTDQREGVRKIRYFGAIATEYVRGLSIKNLCSSYDPEETRLAPKSYNTSSSWLEGVVKSLHVGVQWCDLNPQNILATVLDLNGSSVPTRVVFSDFPRTEIYEKAQLARNPEWPSRHPLTELPNPPLPFEWFCIDAISLFLGCSEYSVFRTSMSDYDRRIRELGKIVADLGAESRSSQPEASYDEDCENVIEGLRSRKADEWVVRNVETVNGAAHPSWLTIYGDLNSGTIVSRVKFLTSKRQRSESEDASEEETSTPKRQKQ
ncbi:hypothetical protein CGLO_08895 [Colletotrichum gloeosporioides Cg-14]|uniref:Uncharacterized protein n=1 Tax=Colletotrichum gloeosporioides (strain Cg-14) TaxID=1237896 RepID=T0KF07_COLGC|nr:hypothetical protein CGLO_08895 [Colletotrichum gloeosporioides Cg-14]